MTAGVRVSVIIPFFNAGMFLREAIESVFAQTYESWELVLVDDGSVDASTAVALQYASLYPLKVHYHEHAGHQNKGASASRNLGSSVARGEYLAFLDSDDVWLPEKLGCQVSILETHRKATMVYGPGLWWYTWAGDWGEGHRDFVQQLGLEPNILVHPPDLLKLFLRNEDAVPSSFAVMIRRDLYQRVGGSDERFRSIYDDQIVFAKVGLAGPVFVSGECWYRYRQHPDQRVHTTARLGEYHATRRAFLLWLEDYLRQQRIHNVEVWRTLRRELRPYRHPHLHALIDQGLYRFAVRITSRIARVVLPERIVKLLRGIRSHDSQTLDREG